MESSLYDDRGDVMEMFQRKAEGMQVAAGATALDWNGVLHSRTGHGIQWRVAWCSFFVHRFVHRSAPDRGPAALKFTQRRTAA